MKGTILAFIAVALFSLYAVFGKILLNSISPFVILLLTQILAGVILILILDLTRKIREIRQMSKRDIKVISLVSIFTSVGGPLLFLFGLRLTSATNSILISQSEVVLTSLLAILILKDSITKHQIFGALIMLFGVVMIVTKTFSIGLQLNVGDIFIFLSALSYACGTILFKKFLHRIHPEIIVTLRNLFGASILFVISLFFVDYMGILKLVNLNFVFALLGLVILTTILAQYLWYKALEITSATNVSLAGLSSPLLGVFYAVVFLKESLVSYQIVGGACMVVGLVVLEFHFKKKHRRHLKLKHWPRV